MAQNFIQEGVHLTITNTTGSAITSGSPVNLGGINGVALGDIAVNAEGVIKTEGIFEFPKKASLALTVGDEVYWDATPGEITKTAADGFFIGYAAKSVASSATTCAVSVEEKGCQSTPVAATVAAVATANGSDAGTTQALANQLKTSVNAILTSLKNAGLMAS